MKIEFNQTILDNFDYASNKEWIESNQLGGYAASTIYGLNNRRYHGLFVVPGKLDSDRIIILSRFEESVFINRQVYELSTNQFSGGVYPQGYQYLKKVTIDPFPKFHFEIENKRIEKTLFILHNQNTLVIRYEYKNQGSPINLVLKPMIAGRNISELSHEVSTINTDSYLETGVVKLAPKDNVPELKIYYQNGEYIPAPLWYHNYVYEMDSRRKHGYSQAITEDLFNPGFFTCTLKPYEALDLFISIDNLNNFDYNGIYRKEKEFRLHYSPVVKNLPDVAKDISKRLEILTNPRPVNAPLSVSNFPEHEVRLGETLYSLRALSYFDQYNDAIKKTITLMVENLNKGLLPDDVLNTYNDGSEHHHYADLSLTLIDIVYHLYIKGIFDKTYIEETLYTPFKNIIELFSKGTSGHVQQGNDGLVSCGNSRVRTSWVLQKSGGDRKIRHDTLLEVNALWYNSLKIMEFFSRELGKKRYVKRYASMAEVTKKSFLKKFWSSKNLRFFDLIHNGTGDVTFAISQLFLIGLPYSMLDTEKAIFTLKQIEEYLLTPFGLRSLSPNEKLYKGRLLSQKNIDDIDYYCGSIWPWAIGMYVDAVLEFRGKNSLVIQHLSKSLETLSRFFYEGGLGNISEFFEGNPPHRRNGRLCDGVNLAELMRSYLKIASAGDMIES